MARMVEFEMSIEHVIDELEDLIEESWRLPMSGGRVVVSAESIARVLEDLRLHLPKEIVEARKIVTDRTQIIERAKNEAETLTKLYREKAKHLVNRDEIIKNAQIVAKDMLMDAKQKSREMRLAASKYAEKLMKDVEDALSMNLAEIKKVKQSLKNNVE
jgi:hypothetical protein